MTKSQKSATSRRLIRMLVNARIKGLGEKSHPEETGRRCTERWRGSGRGAFGSKDAGVQGRGGPGTTACWDGAVPPSFGSGKPGTGAGDRIRARFAAGSGDGGATWAGRRRGRGEGRRRGALGILQIRAAAEVAGGRRGRSGDEAAAALRWGSEEKRPRGAPASWRRRSQAAHREEAAGTASSGAKAHVDDGGEVAGAGVGDGGGGATGRGRRRTGRPAQMRPGAGRLRAPAGRGGGGRGEDGGGAEVAGHDWPE
nr:alanine and glycine-rich protein-like [Aegilops tauschii subsp. strangulata]